MIEYLTRQKLLTVKDALHHKLTTGKFILSTVRPYQMQTVQKCDIIQLFAPAESNIIIYLGEESNIGWGEAEPNITFRVQINNDIGWDSGKYLFYYTLGELQGRRNYGGNCPRCPYKKEENS